VPCLHVVGELKVEDAAKLLPEDPVDDRGERLDPAVEGDLPTAVIDRRAGSPRRVGAAGR
jgi:hypothetical protein